MRKYTRVCIAIAVLLSILLLAKNKVAWAANPTTQNNQLTLIQGKESASPDGDDDCSKGNNKNKDKCKDKDKDKCKDKHHDCGTVKPPDDDVDICEQGGYSVGGVAVVDVKNLKDRNRKDDCFHAHSESSDNLSGLPRNTSTVLSNLMVLTSVGQGSNIKICFAALPGKEVKIYFSGHDSWKPVGTQVKNGIACAHVPGSGSFVLVGK